MKSSLVITDGQKQTAFSRVCVTTAVVPTLPSLMSFIGTRAIERHQGWSSVGMPAASHHHQTAENRSLGPSVPTHLDQVGEPSLSIMDYGQ
ncbi:unnamed protein product [Sympodiomycopsis kandeliae]